MKPKHHSVILLVVGTLALAAQNAPSLPSTAAQSQNFAVHIHGIPAPSTSVDLTLAVTPRSIIQDNTSASFVGGKVAIPMPDGTLSKYSIPIHCYLQLAVPDPASGIASGTYVLTYAVSSDYPMLMHGEAAQTNAVVANPIGIQSLGITGQVLLHPGQTVTVSDIPGLGPMHLTLGTFP